MQEVSTGKFHSHTPRFRAPSEVYYQSVRCSGLTAFVNFELRAHPTWDRRRPVRCHIDSARYHFHAKGWTVPSGEPFDVKNNRAFADLRNSHIQLQLLIGSHNADEIA